MFFISSFEVSGQKFYNLKKSENLVDISCLLVFVMKIYMRWPLVNIQREHTKVSTVL